MRIGPGRQDGMHLLRFGNTTYIRIHLMILDGVSGNELSNVDRSTSDSEVPPEPNQHHVSSFSVYRF